MARFHSFKNGADSIRQLPSILIADGDLVSPRKQQTREIRNMLIEVEDPTDVTMLGIGRNWNAKIAVAEFLQLVGGFSDPAAMALASPVFKNFILGGSLHGAYGPRISMQMQPALDRLRADPDTRQSVVTIWDPLHDLHQEDRKDVPCTLNMSFAIRDDKFLLSTHMRSNDVWWGWCYDLFQFTQLQCTIANMLNLEPGPYVHYADSFHLYTRDEDAAMSITTKDTEPRPKLQGLGMANEANSWRDVQHLAYDIFYAKENTDDMSVTEAWMNEVISGVGHVESPVVE